MNDQPPSHTSEDLTLSDDQRGKLLEFVAQFDLLYGDADFDCQAEWSDAELLALALRAAEILGFEGDALERFFCDEFGVAGITEGDLGTLINIVTVADVENRIRAAAGGRN